MTKNLTVAALLTVAGATLGACDGSPSQQPTAASSAPVHEVVADSTTVKALPPEPVPFVNGTKVGRVLGGNEPSPPASRTR